MMHEYWWVQDGFGHVTYNASVKVLYISHLHNGECSYRKARNCLKKLTLHVKRRGVGGRMVDDYK